jgi:hypothetical protein
MGKNVRAKVLKALHNLLTIWDIFTGKRVYKNSPFMKSMNSTWRIFIPSEENPN